MADLTAGTNTHKIWQFKILTEVGKMNSNITNMIFGRSDFSIFRDMFTSTSLETPLQSKGTQECLFIFSEDSSKHKDHPF